jgi:glycosyltransferase involved in cell wall biosynthesis
MQINMGNNKVKVLFIGSFARRNETTSIGGQRYACTTIIASNLSEYVDWIKLDSTAASGASIPLYVRIIKAIKRFLLYIFFLSTRKVNTVLIFSVNGFSILEKGVMVLIGKIYFKKVILAPRGGPIIDDLKRTFYRKFMVLVFKKCDYIICQSQYWKDIFLELNPNLDKEKFVVVKNWIDISRYASASSWFDRPKAPLHILYLAWVERVKGVHDLIDAAANVLKQNRNIQLTIAGDGKETQAIREKARAYGIEKSVAIAGWVSGEKKKQLLHQADIFVLPSYYEGSPNALKEAMASGIPSIATSVGAIPEIIQDGVNGFLYEAGNVEQLSGCIIKLVDDDSLRQSFSGKGRETIQQNHNLENAVMQLKKILL